MTHTESIQKSTNTSTARADIAIEMKNVDKFYGQFHVLKDINIKVRQGEIVVLCGPSGSGKSTLIRCINRLEVHQKGQIIVDNVELDDNIEHLAEIRKDVGMVFQHFNLFPHLTILENCTIAPIWVNKQPKKDADALAMNFLERVGLQDHVHKFPGQLSGGQKQRVAIARSLCMNPNIILFDEPTSALDPEMVKEILDVMMDIAKEGITMMCVTHEMGFARQVADRIIFMDEGTIIEEAKPDDFFNNPQTDRAKDFLSKIMTH